MKNRLSFSNMTGRFQLAKCKPGSPLPSPSTWTTNTVQYGAADIIGRVLTGDAAALPSGIYFEFTNNLAAWVKPTDFGRSGYTYFHSLSSDTDIIRVPLLLTPGYDTTGSPYSANRVTFVAQSGGIDGVAGENGNLNFTRGVSYIVGGGVIAMVDDDDWSQDLVFTRGYTDNADAVLRPADPNEVMLRWQFVVG